MTTDQHRSRVAAAVTLRASEDDDELAAAVGLVQCQLEGVVVWTGRRGECPFDRAAEER